MRSLALFCLVCLLALSAAAQPGKKPATSTKPKPSAAKPKPSATPVKNESAEWEKASTTVGDTDRVAALRTFVAKYPNSTRLAEAGTLMATSEASLGNERLAASDVAGAATYFKAAANDAATPISDELFNGTLIKFPANLYFRGARTEAVEIAKVLESKVSDSSARILAVASFYLNIENGSEAKRLVEAAIKIEPTSSAAYQMLGLADRVDFLLDQSAAAYAKAIELEPDSLSAKRGLAEMKRALGDADTAATLYRDILEKDPANVPAQTGLVLSLFDAGKRYDAETEMAKVLENTPGNIILLAGAAYWYAAHDLPDKAVENARKAVESDPRFIWSHIALARGLLGQKKPAEAERILLAARRYGNFPTLEYEIASARVAAGYYREAAEGLAKSFSVKDGVVRTVLGGRIERGSKDLSELVSYERRASIFAPTAADSPENGARLVALLEFQQELNAAEPKPELLATAADNFIKGDDRMKLHRQLFAAARLLEKQVAFPKVVEIAKAAVPNVSAGLDDANAATAVTAAELYEPRSLAAERGEYVDVPSIPRMTLSAIVRGQIEELSGWALFQMNDAPEAVNSLRRAVAVLPADSAWWRSSTWRLGTVMAATGRENDALEMFVKSYKGGTPDAFRYAAIEGLYTKLKGSTEGLEALIGPDPSPKPVAETVAQVAPSPTPEPEASSAPSPAAAPNAIPSVVPVATPEPTPAVIEPLPLPIVDPTPEATPTPNSPVAETPVPEVVPAETPAPAIEPSPTAESEPSPTPEPTPTAQLESSPTPEPTPAVVVVRTPTPPRENATVRPLADLFPPVVITIPQPGVQRSPAPAVPGTERTTEPLPTPAIEPESPEPSPNPTPSEVEPTPSPSPTASPEKGSDGPTVAVRRPRFADAATGATASVKPCKITFSEEAVDLQVGGGELAVIVGRDDDSELGEISAVASSPRDLSVKRQALAGMKTRALYVVRPVGERTGVFQVTFEMACAKRDLIVRVR